MNIKIMTSFFLMIIFCNASLIAEEKNKTSDYTWMQWIGKKGAQYAGMSICAGISGCISPHLVHPDDSNVKIGIVYSALILASIIGGAMAGGAVADKIMGKSEKDDEPSIISFLLQDQFNKTKENEPAT